MTLRTHHGLPIANLATHRRLARLSLATINGLGPLPGITPLPSGDIPLPTHYFGFEAYPESSYTGSGSGIGAAIGSTPWVSDPGLVLYERAGNNVAGPEEEGQQQLLNTMGGARTGAAFSFWLSPGSDLSVWSGLAPNYQTLINAVNAGANIEHHLFIFTPFVRYHFQGGAQVSWGGGYDFSAYGHDFTLFFPSGDSGAVDEMAVWDDPDWTKEQAAAYAAALYNGGLGTVYRDGQWWEVAE